MQGAGHPNEATNPPMSSLKKYPHHDPATIVQLVENCTALCKDIEGRAINLPAEKGDFLMNNLGDALRKVELVLRVLDEETAESRRKSERKGFLKRLFGREDEEGAAKGESDDQYTLPDFNVSKQGLQGNVSTVPMAELLSFLAFGKKTGVLWVDSPKENFLLAMVKGQLCHANSDKTPEGLRLGEILVGLGCLTRRQLERFIEQLGAAQPVTGDKLVENGMISEEELRSALLYQTQQLFYRLIKIDDAMFRFREGMEVKLSHRVELDINSLLLDNARALDEEDHKDERNKAVEQEWSSWQDELSSKLTTASDDFIEEAGDEDQGEGETVKASSSSTDGETKGDDKN